jgi:DNA-binding transcriptional ArsR family regulator
MRRVGMVDLDTGEVLSGVPVWVGAKARSPYGDRWIAVSQDFLEELAARRDVHGETLRVFVFLNARLDFNNLIQVPMIEIAERLGMKPPNVRRAMKKLEELGVVVRGPKAGRSSSYRLNPNAGWKGKVTELRKRLHAVE